MRSPRTSRAACPVQPATLDASPRSFRCNDLQGVTNDLAEVKFLQLRTILLLQQSAQIGDNFGGAVAVANDVAEQVLDPPRLRWRSFPLQFRCFRRVLARGQWLIEFVRNRGR